MKVIKSKSGLQVRPDLLRGPQQAAQGQAAPRLCETARGDRSVPHPGRWRVCSSSENSTFTFKGPNALGTIQQESKQKLALGAAARGGGPLPAE